MTKLSRILYRLSKELKGYELTKYERLQLLIDVVVDWVGDKTHYYEVKAFFLNLPHFIRQAWYWRGFDSHYTIIALVENLEELARQLQKSNTHVGGIKAARRCKFAAHLLNNAYNNHNLPIDKSYQLWSKHNPVLWDEPTEVGKRLRCVRLKHRYKYGEEYAHKMFKIITKRTKIIEEYRKKEAWSYIHKYIEHWWD